MSITSILALFILLLLSSAVFFVARRVKIPYTVLLVIVGLLLVPLVRIPFLEPTLGFLEGIVLTPELLFYVFLPMLIFESAFNMNMRKIVENAWHISLLSVVGLLISSVVIATALYFIFGLIGLPVPFIITLLFGAIISSTDPVAVLALFKEYGAPKRLTLIFEGESLFNDGTAVALFLVVLAIATGGFNGTQTVLNGLGTFLMMVILGIAFGILMATLFSRGLRYTRSNEFVTITVLIVSAHIVFILSELINTHEIFGLHLHMSPIIATTVAALFLGNYARHILPPQSESYLKKSIEHLAFVANSLVFLLAGILFASTDIDFGVLWLPMLISVLVVAAARIVSVYAVTIPLNRLRPVSKIPDSWQFLLAWGSLRGALAIIVVLLVPDSFQPAGWSFDFTAKELLLALTIGCILATLFIKATTIGRLVTKLGVNRQTPFQEARMLDLGMYYLQTEKNRIKEQNARGFVRASQYRQLRAGLEAKIGEVADRRSQLLATHSPKLFIQSLHYAAISIEDHYLRELYANGEVTESVYRKIIGKLNLQREKIEYAQHEAIDPSSYTDRKDVFERLVAFTQSAFDRATTTTLEDKYQYYRAQSIIARKAVKTLTQMQSQYGQPVFDDWAFDTVVAIYESYRKENEQHVEQLTAQHKAELEPFITALSLKTLHSTGNKSLRFFHHKGMADEDTLDLVERRYSMSVL